MRRMIALVGVALAVCASAFAQTEESPATWYTIFADSGPKLGHVSLEARQRADGRELIETQLIAIRERGSLPNRTTTRTVVREDIAGRTLSIESTSRSGRFWTRTSAQVRDDVVAVERETPNGLSHDSVSLPEGVRFDDGEALLAAWQPETTPHLEFLSFDTDAMFVERVVIEPRGAVSADGRLNAVRWRYEGDDLRGVARLVLERGRVIEVAQPMFGETFRVRETDRATALEPHPPYQVIPNMAQRAPFRISPEARRGHIRFRYAFRDDVAFPLPQTGEQRVRTEPGFITLDICERCGPGLPTDAAYLAAASRPTTWLQSDHPRLRAMTRAIREYNVSDARKMELLWSTPFRTLRTLTGADTIPRSIRWSAAQGTARKLLCCLPRSAAPPAFRRASSAAFPIHTTAITASATPSFRIAGRWLMSMARGAVSTWRCASSIAPTSR